MTEASRPPQGPLAPSDDSLFPSAAGLEGENIAPSSVVGAVDDTHAAGLDLKVRSQWSYARMRFFRHRLALVGLFGLVIIFGAGVFAGLITPYSYSEIDLNHILQGPSHAHYFGTDALGRDEYTRVVETAEHGGYPLLDHLRKILEGPIVWAPGVKGAATRVLV